MPGLVMGQGSAARYIGSSCHAALVDGIGADADALAKVRAICAGFAGADEGELQDRPLFRVGRRRFAIFSGISSPPRPRWAPSGRSLHFLVDPAERDALAQDGRFFTSPHHGDRGWFGTRLDEAQPVDWAEIAELLESAYMQVRPQRVVDGDELEA